ncbi:Structural maintenance of chromosome complex subunit SmcA [Penicillium digitatum]|uniref:Structural maintenance of chromosomes protein 5 n=3 Tax=Penicillium digitatum TaxID=36651 RepID=K9GQ85_PEND2|nr:Structural maintenance of chromosome complex subunit SmcA [Penicillium digitatum Pd1]EKV10025.1 Structural maintenance of chromosome complex subunit SmcA [Penicillium digitatum Pd1]EKV15281.1 Structural maintenance of chromosome complex subunit SmcA [Penicillium digitatum PHI26]QQK44348.1 Structural maintenance of chromosome complex subunit SmcA [Penicillium digitatum]
MASPGFPRRRPRSEDEEGDDPALTPPAQPANYKRPRLNPAESDDGSEPGDESEGEGEGESDEDSARSETPEAVSQAPRAIAHDGLGPGGYKPGAIVRIKVTNFVTYTSAVFYPGPKLNMVIGPNGTGKSTLVCAICLGLGWGPQQLGRAKDLGEFVKHGAREAMIEIELCGPPKVGQNPVIQRNIKRDGNKSSFTLDGSPASKSDVLKLAQSFAIQVDNLCQFLPQDKVAEFAALTPVELLHSTQRAAAGPEMTQWHEALKTLRAEQKKLEVQNADDKELLENMENRQEMQRADVERMRQRAVIKRKIEILERCRPIVEYKEHHNAVEALKITKAEAEREYNRIRAENEPILRAVNAKEAYIARLNGVKDGRKDSVDKASRVATERGQKIDDFESRIKDLNGQIEAEKKSGQRHKTEAASAQQAINRLRRQQEEEAVEFDPEHYNETLREKRLKKREIEIKVRESQDRRQPLQDQQQQVQRKIQQAERQLSNLDSASGQQELKLQKASYDTLKAYRWLLENQSKFEKEVFGPPIVTCSITNPKFADAVESLFQKTDFTSFTVQTRNDFRTLQFAINKTLGLHDISIRTCSLSLDTMRAPMPKDQLTQLGFDGWAKDFLVGPDPVIAMLCSEKNLHSTAIGLREISNEVFARLEEGLMSSWVSGKKSYQVTRRREYGPGATSTRVREIKPAQVWTEQPVDVSLKREHQENITLWNEQLQDIKEKLESERAMLLKIREEHEQAEREMKDIEREKSAKQTAHTQYRAIPEKISQQEARLKNIKSLFEGVRERVREIRNQQDEFAIQKAEAAVEYADSVEWFRLVYEDLMKVEVLFLEATSDLQTLRHRNIDRTQLLEAKRREAQEATVKLRESKVKARAVFQRAHQISRELHNQPDAQALLEELDDHDMDKLEADIDSEKARLELTHGGSSHMIKEFEDREKSIEKLRSKLADFQGKLSELGTAIADIRKDWEPKLEALIEKISDAFSDSFRRIGCAGQVTLGKVESEFGPNGEPGASEFGEWSIVIHVQFREGAGLSVLDSHRQSGGERAVSTIFYLMALQSLSASPFRVVDEINQGMDPRNERMVHGRLVDIACASDETEETDENGNPIGGGGGGQYFLITPKLLEQLSYKPGMRVLCIYSGEHMPEDYDKANFKKAIKSMRAVAARTITNVSSEVMQSNGQVDVYA